MTKCKYTLFHTANTFSFNVITIYFKGCLRSSEVQMQIEILSAFADSTARLSGHQMSLAARQQVREKVGRSTIVGN